MPSFTLSAGTSNLSVNFFTTISNTIDIASSGIFITSVNTTDGNYNRQNFGVGSRLLTAGECAVDVTNRVILLNTSFPYPHVILQYISSPEQDDDYSIPIQFQEAMIAWIYWQENQYMPNTNKGSGSGKQQAAQNFKSQLLKARKDFKPIRVQDIALQAKEAQRYDIH